MTPVGRVVCRGPASQATRNASNRLGKAIDLEQTSDAYSCAKSARVAVPSGSIDALALHPGVARLRECRMAYARLEGIRILPDRLVSYSVVQPGAGEFHEEAHVLRHASIEFDGSQLPKFLQGQTVWGSQFFVESKRGRTNGFIRTRFT
jgi:hypothetical protein